MATTHYHSSDVKRYSYLIAKVITVGVEYLLLHESKSKLRTSVNNKDILQLLCMCMASFLPKASKKLGVLIKTAEWYGLYE